MAKTISIIIPVHHEGNLIHITLNSVKRAIRHLESIATDISTEIIVVMDSPNKETLEYFKTYSEYETYQVDFKDLGLSRNFGVEKAQGDFICFMDADDLMSENWLEKAYINAISNDKKTLFHPKFTVYFDREIFIARHLSSDDPKFLISNLLENNYWTALFFTSRSNWKELEYSSSTNGFGYEDWHLYTEALAKGYKVKCLDETLYFIRRKKSGSLLAIHNLRQHTIRYSSLFEREILNHLIEKEKNIFQVSKSHKLIWKLKNVLRHAKNNLLVGHDSFINSYLIKKGEELKILMGLKKQTSIDLTSDKFKWLIKEWREINDIEPMLFPQSSKLRHYPFYETPNTFIGYYYFRLLKLLQGKFDYIFLVPWLKKGGAEKVILNYIYTIKKLNKPSKIALITTENTSSPWIKKLPEGVEVLEFGKKFEEISTDQKTNLLMRYFIQEKPKRLHLINSPIGFNTLDKYAEVISNDTKIYVTVFTEDYTKEGRRVGYMYEYLPSFIKYVTCISTDNERIIKELHRVLNIDMKKFKTHYQPVEDYSSLYIDHKHTNTLNVLWASRLDEQKNPNLLIEIIKANKNSNIKFHIWGSKVLDVRKDYQTIFSDLDNTKYYGGYNDFKNLNLERYDLFIYTAKYDGMPNILLEVASAGIPIITTPSGATSELIRDKVTGLIAKTNDEFIEALDFAFNNRKVMEEYAMNAKKLVQKRHSLKEFEKDCMEFYGYL